MSPSVDSLRIRRLLDAGRAIVAELDPLAVLNRTLVAAREVTGARYAALGILDEERTKLEHFLTLGVDEQTRSAIGELPQGLGVLGVPIEDPHPLRLSDVGQHPRSYGFPEGHPVLKGFLGVPILIRGTAWGTLYLAEKQDGEFTKADEEAAVIFADWAATATSNARLHRTPQELAGAIVASKGLERVLELIIRRGRALIDARSGTEGDAAGDDDETSLRAFAASAAAAVAMAENVESERLRGLMAAADAERSRWARELHDETLQGLGGLRLLLASARRRDNLQQTELAVDEAIGLIEQQIENLHAIISDLRPAALDVLGLRPALEALLERRSDQGTLTIASEFVLPGPMAGEERLDLEIESTVYRLVQEALTNIDKHANARNVRVAVTASGDAVTVEVQDDGVGFVPDAAGAGFGLTGMRERVFLAGGTLRIDSDQGGTQLRAELPVHRTITPGPSARAS
jgi:signal transduction histidine kinase